MASILKVNTIQDATNSKTALSIDSSGRVLTPARPSFQYDITNYSGGTNYLSSTYKFGSESSGNDLVINYFSPIPFINAITTDGFTTNVGSGASFVNHPASSSYKYLKFTAPIAGLYCFGMVVDFANRHSGVDYLAYGLKKNTASESASSSGSSSTFDKALIHHRPNAERGHTTSGTNIIDLAVNDFVVFYSRSVSETQFHTSSSSFFGYLIG